MLINYAPCQYNLIYFISIPSVINVREINVLIYESTVAIRCECPGRECVHRRWATESHWQASHDSARRSRVRPRRSWQKRQES